MIHFVSRTVKFKITFLLEMSPSSFILLLLEVLIFFPLIMMSYGQPSLVLSSLNIVLSAVTNVLLFPPQSIHTLVYANYLQSTFVPC